MFYQLIGPYENHACYDTWWLAFMGLVSIVRERSRTAGSPLLQVWYVFTQMRIVNWDKQQRKWAKYVYPIDYFEDILATYNANPILQEQVQALGIHLVGDDVYYMYELNRLVNLAVMEGNATAVYVSKEIEY